MAVEPESPYIDPREILTQDGRDELENSRQLTQALVADGQSEITPAYAQDRAGAENSDRTDFLNGDRTELHSNRQSS